MSAIEKRPDMDGLALKKFSARLAEGLPQHKKEAVLKLLECLDPNFNDDQRKRWAQAFSECLSRKRKRVSRSVKEVLAEYDTSGIKKHRSAVADAIANERNKRGWTQQELASKAGLPQSHISRIETQQLTPTAKTIMKISKALGIRMIDIDLGFDFDDEERFG